MITVRFCSALSFQNYNIKLSICNCRFSIFELSRPLIQRENVKISLYVRQIRSLLVKHTHIQWPYCLAFEVNMTVRKGAINNDRQGGVYLRKSAVLNENLCSSGQKHDLIK